MNKPTITTRRTLCFLVKKQASLVSEVCLGYKKRGLGQGFFLGIGGKAEAGESMPKAAVREVKEEIDVSVARLVPVGAVTFFFTDKPSWNQKVYLFVSEHWQGDPQESDEVRPQWFSLIDVPYEKMWEDARYWLPLVLAGKSIKAEFLYDQNIKIINKKIKAS